jgi:hypothetical protein
LVQGIDMPLLGVSLKLMEEDSAEKFSIGRCLRRRKVFAQ